MEYNFEQLIAALNTFPLSPDVLSQIALLLEQQSAKPYSALLALQQWAWQLLSEDSHQWIHQPDYQHLFYALASFNKNFIFTAKDVEADDKASLLFPATVDQIDRIFQQIESTNDNNDPYITIVGLWFDNHSYFLYINCQCTVLSITDHINQHIIDAYMMSEQLKLYLSELQQTPLPSSVFTARMLFYLKTCLFSLLSYMEVRAHNFPYTPDEILRFVGNDYLRIIHIHSRVVASWSEELLTCLAHLIAYIARSCCLDPQKRTQINSLFSTDEMTCDHVQDLINIIAYEPLQKQMKAVRSNVETILIDSTVVLLMFIAQTQNVNWFFRASSTIQNVLSSVAERSLYDELCVCTYGLLGEVLSDEQLKNLKIANAISGFFFSMLERAWHHPLKRYKQIPIEYLLRGKRVVRLCPDNHQILLFLHRLLGFSNLAKHDFIQQKTADSNEIPLLIEISESYPIIYDILWALSFNADVQQQLRSSSTFMSKLAHLTQENRDEQMRKMTHGLLWNLEINHEDEVTTETDKEKVFDIMISYSHKNKELCGQLYQELMKVGYRVWIDFDQMHGNVMDAMAQAIEQSQTVIICMSEDYRKSNYCRAEAHYAFQRQRKIVPVLLQKHYKPDGWLLFLIGQLLYVDFKKYEFCRAMKMLFKELQVEGCVKTNELPVAPVEDTYVIPSDVSVVSSPRVLRSSTSSQTILEWTEEQVQEWLLKHNLVQMSRLLAKCDGRSLVYLSKYMKSCQPQQILNLLQEDALQRTKENVSLIEIACFHSLMDQVKQPLRSMETKTNIKQKDC